MNQTLTHDEHHHDTDALDIFGFWLYILTDCILFATLFATYAVLHNNTFGGPSMKELTSLPYVFTETMLLLTSSFTYGLSMLALYKKNRPQVMFWLGLTFLLGLGFIGMEVNEFAHMIHEGHTWQTSGALSAFFTLVGTHGLHVFTGLIWMVVLMVQLAVYNIDSHMTRRLTYLGLFWHFLDIVWIFVFTIVYLMGVI
jgi:cytochrome o ubiquinol oxidase subunit III